MKTALCFALTLAVSSTAAMAQTSKRALSEPSARKSGSCTGCACCDYIVVAGIKIPIGVASATPASRRD